MAIVQNVIAIESKPQDPMSERNGRDSAEYCEKEWIRDPWITRIVARAEEKLQVEQKPIADEAVNEAAPPLLPSEPRFDWKKVRRLP